MRVIDNRTYRTVVAALVCATLVASTAYARTEVQVFDSSKEQEEANAGNVEFDYRLGIAAIKAGKPVDAVFALQRVITLAPGFLPARAALSRAYAMLGAYGAAAREIEVLLAQDEIPPAVRARLEQNLARMTTARDRRNDAVESARIGSEYRQGIAALDAGNTAEAIHVLERLLEQKPNHVPARAELGRAYAEAGRYRAARRELTRVSADQQVPDEVRENINRYISALDTHLVRQQRTRVSGRVRLRSGYDSNVNNATDEERILIPAFSGLGLATLSPDAREQEDAFTETAGRLSVVHRLSGGDRLLADLSGNFRKNFDETGFDQLTLGGNLGHARETRTGGTFSLVAQAQTFLVDDEVFRNTFGALAGWSGRTDAGTDLAANLQYGYLVFPDDDARDAHRLALGGTAGRTWGEVTYAFGGLYGGREITSDDIGRLDQWFLGARAGIETRPTDRLRLHLTLLGERQVFDEEEPLFLEARRTWRIDLRGGARFRLMKRLDLLLDAGYTSVDSNIPIFDYNRTTASIGVERTF